MRLLSILCLSLIIVGCASVRMGYYINNDKGVMRKMNGSVDEVVAAAKTVLARYGWPVSKEENPADYERNLYTENSANHNVLLMTDIKQHSKFVYSTYTHINVFCYQAGENADVEIRFQSVTPMVKQFKGSKNDLLMKRILDDIEKEIGG